MDAETFNNRFAQAIEGSVNLIEGEGQYAADKFAELKGLMHEELGIPPEKTHAFKLREKSVDNCLWEGLPLSQAFALGLALVPTNFAVAKPNNVTSFPAAVERRMFPGPNGFEAFAVCVPSEGGKWQISDVVAESESSLATKLRALYPAADLHEAKQKALKRYSKVTGGPPSATSALIESITDHLLEAKNVILQGPPGTGKTYLSTEVICRLGNGLSRSALDDARFSKLLTDAGGNISTLLDRQELGEVLWERVQLHPTFAYDDFVRGMTAVQDGHGMQFVSCDRLLVQMALLARAHPQTLVVLLLDEINRCDLSALLGELIFAIEPGARGLPVRLQYPAPIGGSTEDALALPDNLLFLGTMNTADRSIGLVDYAIRRRFRFLDILPSAASLIDHYSGHPTLAQAAKNIFESINSIISDPHLRIGQSYFFVDPLSENWSTALVDRLFYEVIPMLREYVSEAKLLDVQIVLLNGIPVTLLHGNRADDREARLRLIQVVQT